MATKFTKLTKLTKKESGYILPKLTVDTRGLRCDNCRFYDIRHVCSPVKGYIHPGAVCNIWSYTGSVSLDYASSKELAVIFKTRKPTKLEAGYIDARSTMMVKPYKKGKGTRCGSCISFIGEYGLCKAVDGDINEYACCNLWREDPDTNSNYISGEQAKHKLADIEDLVLRK